MPGYTKNAGEKLKVFISYSRRDIRHGAWNPLDADGRGAPA
jgi:hypothetical protein